MKIRFFRFVITIAPVLLAGHQGLCQGAFVNLDFENPIPPLTPVRVPIANALPGWTGYLGEAQVNQVLYDTITLDGGAISFHDSGSDSLQPLLGKYSVYLQGPTRFAPQANVALAQTGQLPQDALSLLFVASPASINYQVTLGGQIIPLIPLASSPTFNILGGDISMFAGQTVELRFSIPVPPSGQLFFDNVQFSNQPIPEPSVLALVGVGALFLWRFRRRH